MSSFIISTGKWTVHVPLETKGEEHNIMKVHAVTFNLIQIYFFFISL